MKKNVLLLLVLLLASGRSIHAQNMIAYELETTTSPMELIPDGTEAKVKYTGSGYKNIIVGRENENFDESKNVDAPGIPIGFDVSFNGMRWNQFMISTVGVVYLGKDVVKAPARERMKDYFSFPNENIFGFTSSQRTFGLPDTKISYKIDNDKKYLLVQYENLGISDMFQKRSIAKVNAQLLIYQDGIVEVKLSGFKPVENALMSNQQISVGLLGHGQDRVMIADFEGKGTTAEKYSLKYSSDTYPADGITYRFIPPEPCAAPSATPSNLKLASTTEAISGEFEPAQDADHYLVLGSKGQLTEKPQDQVFYEIGDSLGNAQVVAVTDLPKFQSRQMFEPSTSYNIYVIAYNSMCLNGPVYSKQAAVLSESIVTKPKAPKEILVADVDSSCVSFSVKAYENFDVLIAYTDVQASDGQKVYDYGVFGTPLKKYNVGDIIDGGGTVAYCGKGNGNVKVEGLTPGKAYFFRFWSSDGNGGYSSEYLNVSDFTAKAVPWKADIDFEKVNKSAPIGWKGVGNWTVAGDNFLENGIDDDGEEGKTAKYILTPPIYLGEKENRLETVLSLGSFVDRNYQMEKGDTVAVQITTDGKKYHNLFTVTHENKEVFNGGLYNQYHVGISFVDYEGQKVKLRFYLRCHGKATLRIKSLFVEHKPECDYPIEVRDSIIERDKVVVTWKARGDENDWEVSYKKSAESVWSAPVHVKKTSCELSPLEGLVKYDVRVRAVCSKTSHSPWSDIFTFRSGLVLSFMEVFGDEEGDEPYGWAAYQGKLGDPTVLDSSNSDFVFHPKSNWSSARLSLMAYGDKCASWYVSPKFDLIENKGFVATIGLQGDKTYTQSSTDQKVCLVIAKDGKDFYSADTVLVVHQNELPIDREHAVWTTDTIKGYTGTVRIGIYVEANDGPPYVLSIDSLGVKAVDLTSSDGIVAVNSDGNDKVVSCYNIAGQPVRKSEKGINIIKYADGRVRKVLVK